MNEKNKKKLWEHVQNSKKGKKIDLKIAIMHFKDEKKDHHEQSPK